MQIFPKSVQKLWNEWELRSMVLLSLLLQIVLNIFSNQRKYTVRLWIRILIWSAYLSADWVATVSLGTLCNTQGDSEGKLLDPNHTLMAFWAPFLLLHLGGPDMITAYSLEDNELWLRHLLGLVVQVGVAFYVFLRSWARTPLTFLSIPMFVAGIIKYGERTWVLRSASKKQFRDSLLPAPDPGLDYAGIVGPNAPGNFVEQNYEAKDNKDEQNDSTSLDGNDMSTAYFLFENQFRHLYADLILSSVNQKLSAGIITNMKFQEAFKVVEMELSFMYDVLYNKAIVVYSLLGILLRSTSFFCTISTLAAFCFSVDKHEFSNIDINITYILLFGAIFLEIYTIIMLIFSDWSIVWLSCKKNSSINSIYRAITSFRSVLTSDKRWSRLMAQNNLIDSCLRDKTKFDQAPSFFDINKLLESNNYITRENVDDMKEPIFSWLLEMTRDVNDPMKLLKHRGDYVIAKNKFTDVLDWSIGSVEFDHSILLWHIATDLCSYDDEDPNLESRCKCKTSKCLSNYMLYILAMHPLMLPKGIGEFRFRDTCSETKRFFLQRSEFISSRKEACRLLLEVNTDIDPRDVKGDKSKSVLFEACRLAKKLKSLEMGEKEKWDMICTVWMEMLCYAASHCGWIQHGHQLRRGGELLTHICLLMSHLGISEQFQIANLPNPARARAYTHILTLARNPVLTCIPDLAYNPNLALDLTLNPDLTLDLALNPELTLDLALNPDLAFALDLNLDLDLDLALDFAHAHAYNPDLALALALTLALARNLDTDTDTDPDLDPYLTRAHAITRSHTRAHAHSRAITRNLGLAHDSDTDTDTDPNHDPYLTRAHAIICSRSRAITRSRARSRSRARAIALILTRTRAHALALDPDLARTRAWALANDRDLARARARDLARALARATPFPI